MTIAPTRPTLPRHTASDRPSEAPGRGARGGRSVGSRFFLRFSAVILAGLASAGAAGCSTAAGPSAATPAPPFGDPMGWAPDAAGPFHVGYRVASTSSVAPTGATRTLALHLWYPTLDEDGEHPNYESIIRDPLAISDASLAPSAYTGGRYPVHVFSHGHRGIPQSTPFLMRHFASHGWVVVAPRHVGNTLSDPPERAPSIYYLRGLDVTAAITALAKLPATDGLAGKLDTSRVFLSGHSFGTHTVWSSAGAPFDVAAIEARCKPAGTCTEADLAAFRAGVHDKRVIAGLAMAGSPLPDWLGEHPEANVTIPIFYMTGTDDDVGQASFWNRSAPFPLTWVDVEGACHQYYGIGKCPLIDDAKQVPIAGAFSLAFARKTLLRDTSANTADVLAGKKNDAAVATYKTR